MIKKNVFAGEEGLTLVEVAVSVALLGAVTVSLLFILAGGISAVFTSGRQTQAAALAQEKMESLKAVPYEELESKAVLLDGGRESEQPGMPGFEISYGIDRKTVLVENYLLQGLEIEIEVWYEGTRRPVSITSFVGPLHELR